MEELVGNDTNQSWDQHNLERGHCQALQAPTEPMVTCPQVTQEIHHDLGMANGMQPSPTLCLTLLHPKPCAQQSMDVSVAEELRCP